jgi:hypothetical protein
MPSRAGRRDMTPEERAEVIELLAQGDMTCPQVAVQTGWSIQQIWKISGANKEEIETRRRQKHADRVELLAKHWLADADELMSLRGELVERLYRIFSDDQTDKDLLPKYARDINAIARSVEDVEGRLPQRIQARVAMTDVKNCIVGFSCECGQGCDQVKPWPGLRAQTEPEPVHDSPSSVPAEYAGTEAIARELERGALAIVDALKHRAVMHRDEILRLMPGDNTPAKLARALEEGYVTEDDRGQVRLGPVTVPGPAPVPAKYAGAGSR